MADCATGRGTLSVAVMTPHLVIQPTREDWRLAREVHSHFRARPGSQHIATAFALAHLAALLRVLPVKSVLEFGAGIGTITFLLQERLPADGRIVCAERNAWCREQFAINIPQSPRVALIPEGRPHLTDPFDLVIIDGPITPGAQYVRAGTACFVEGNRNGPWSMFADGLSAQGLVCHRTNYPAKGFRIRWRMSRLGLNLPRLRRTKGCWIGVVAESDSTPMVR